MATESFYEDLVIDTPEAAAAFIDFLKRNKSYKVENRDYVFNNPEHLRRIIEMYENE